MAKCDQPGCGFEHRRAQSVGVHRRWAHGIKGRAHPNKAIARVTVEPTPAKTKHSSQAIAPNYCPACGCNLRAIATALQFVAR